ncbi:translocation/assembly module TamB domain-containing protein [Flavihumibacter profundi]|uniref:translocation/assembly module TamB domain-containing protein n=1 Tax=Flavihumibacter profundi TaxID=2716883 RepID=UPI001CC37C3D|nr:translocation/assembly module TamB domain-containing protein [Flavihumibacter profundi]MBZ5856792.1 translocation/assembly module TamB [Flavihumibacter profundi]
MLSSPRKIFKKIAKWLLWVITILICLLLLVWGILQTNWGQSTLKGIAVNYLQKKLHTNLSINSIAIKWLSHIQVNGIYIEDQQKRPLFRLQRLDIGYDISQVFSKRISIPVIDLEGLQLNLYRSTQDSLFNYSFITAAFASKEQAPKDTAGKGYTILPGIISVSKMGFTMADKFGGQEYTASINRFQTTVDQLNLRGIVFHTRNIVADSVYCQIVLTSEGHQKAQQVDTTATPASVIFGSDSVKFSRINFRLENKSSQFIADTKITLLAGNKVKYDLQKMYASAAFITLNDHNTTIQTITNKNAEPAVQATTVQPGKPFTFYVGGISISNNAFSFDDQAFPKSGKKELDPKHIAIEKFSLDAANIGYNGFTYAADLKQMSLVEKNGFQLENLSTNALYSDTAVSLKQLYVKTTKNQINADVRVSFKGISQITTSPELTHINATIKDSRIQLSELLFFQPGLKKNKSFAPLAGKVFYANTSLKGSLDKLLIPEISIKSAQTRLLASAEVYHLPDIKKLLINLRLKEFSGTRKDLLSFLPPNTIQDSLLHYIPNTFSIKGTYKGTLNDLFTDLQIATSEGNASIKGSLKNIADKTNAEYDLTVNTDAVELGKLMEDSLFGNLSATVNVKGKGWDIKTANAVFQTYLREAYYQGYTYHDINFSGKVSGNTLDAHLQSRDPNITVSSDTYYNMDKLHGSFKTNTVIENANLLNLGFLKDTLVISGRLNADIPQLDTAKTNGNILASGLSVQFGSKRFNIDSVQLDAVYANDTQLIQLTTPFADATIKGKYTLKNIPAVAKTIINSYLYTNSNDSVYTHKLVARLDANIHIPDSIATLFPNLKKVSPFNITGTINTDSSSITILTEIPKLDYMDYEIDTLKIVGVNKPGQTWFKELNYGILVNQIKSPSVNLAKSTITGSILHGKINGRIDLFDENLEPKYSIPYNITNDPDLPYLHMEDSLLINKRPWKVNDNNIIYLNTSALKGSNLVISKNDELISLSADTTVLSGLPLKLDLKQFKLKNISEIIISDTALVEGTVNGGMVMQSFVPFSFTSDITIDSLRLKGVNAGNLSLNAGIGNENIINVNVALKGSDNDVTLSGTYQPKESTADLALNMKQFSLRNIEPFTKAYLGKLSGEIIGDLTIKSKISNPDIRGILKTQNIEAVYKDFGTYIKIPAGEVVFSEEGIRLNEFNFTDSAGHKGLLEGSIQTSGFPKYQLDLKLTTNGFLAIDKKKYPDQTIYGPASVDALISLKGNEEAINVDGTVKVLDNSNFTYINTTSETQRRGDGLIEFFDPAHPSDSLTVIKEKEKASAGPKISVNTYLTITPSSNVNIVMDETSGDNLKINGTAGLNLSRSAEGKISLTGNYTVEKGDYDLSIAQIIKKTFILQKGSSITWSGDPLNADLNLTALYKVKTTAAELVGDIQSIPGIDKQKFNVEVYMMFTKKLSKPDINFRLDLPVNEREVFDGIVYTRIKQVNNIPSELNKQVMGLLAFGQFIAENPFSSFSSTTSTAFETRAYATAGRLLTQELTDLAGNAVKGVEFDVAFDVYEDYTSGSSERNTDLKVGVSKSMANNRLKVYVGSNFALEGHNQNENALSGLAGDIIAEYQLSSDGKYRIKGFRITENELTFEGNVVKTGVTFVVVLEFNKFKNAFKKQKNK